MRLEHQGKKQEANVRLCLKNASVALDHLIRLMFFIRHLKCQGISGFSVNLNSITWQALIAH